MKKFRYWWWLCLAGVLGILVGSELVRGQDHEGGGPGKAGAEKAETGEEASEIEDPLDRFRTKEESYEGMIVVIPVGERDLISGARFEFMQRILERADEEKATAVILDMNTPGGLAWASGELIMNHLSKMEIPTYCYINPNAASAGAIIAVGTDTIYMAPTSAVGAALAVSGTGQDLGETMEKKMDSYLRAQVRSVAKANGHNPDLAEAFVDDDVELVIEVGPEDKEKYPMGSILLSKKGEVLSLDHEQATEVINGKPVFAKGIAKDVEDLVAQEELVGEIIVAEPLGLESFALLVTRFSMLLLALGIAGAYMEMQSPGFGIPGAVSLICFGIFFFGHFMAGKLAGLEVVAVFFLGLILIGVEVFLFPGTLVFGFTGVVMMLGALLYTMAGTTMGDGGGWFAIDMSGLRGALMNLSLGLAGAVILVAVLMRYLPETRAMSWLILKTAVAEGPSLDPAQVSGEEGESPDGGTAEMVGMSGTTLSALRPAGKARFDGKVMDVVSDGEFIDAGAAVKIVAREGSRILVVAV